LSGIEQGSLQKRKSTTTSSEQGKHSLERSETGQNISLNTNLKKYSLERIWVTLEKGLKEQGKHPLKMVEVTGRMATT
jgi:hypothetical protein